MNKRPLSSYVCRGTQYLRAAFLVIIIITQINPTSRHLSSSDTQARLPWMRGSIFLDINLLVVLLVPH